MKPIALLLALILMALSAAAADSPPLESSAAAEWAALLADREAQYEAQNALKAAGPSALPVLLVLAEKESALVRSKAMWLISELGPSAIPAMQTLLRRLDDQDQSVRRSAAYALGKIGNAAAPAVPLLVRMLDDEKQSTRRTAARALWKILPAGPEALLTSLQAGNASSVEALAQGKSLATDLVIPLLDNDATRPLAEATLIRIGFMSVPKLEAAGHDDVAARVIKEGLERYLFDQHDEYVLVADSPSAAAPRSLDLTWEYGSGHGHTLCLHHLTWTADSLEITVIGYGCARGTQPRDAPIVVNTAKIDPALGDAVCRALLQAMALRLEKKPPDPGTKPGLGDSAWHNTGDFHSRLMARSGDQVIYEKAYGGYPGSQSIAHYFDLRIISGLLLQAIDGLTWTERSVTEADLVALDKRTTDMGKDAWWVQERFLLMIRAIGDKRFLPTLEAAIRAPIRVVARPQLYAIDAYARISGLDLRPRVFGEDDVSAIRQKYVEHFDRR